MIMRYPNYQKTVGNRLVEKAYNIVMAYWQKAGTYQQDIFPVRSHLPGYIEYYLPDCKIQFKYDDLLNRHKSGTIYPASNWPVSTPLAISGSLTFNVTDLVKSVLNASELAAFQGRYIEFSRLTIEAGWLWVYTDFDYEGFDVELEDDLYLHFPNLREVLEPLAKRSSFL